MPCFPPLPHCHENPLCKLRAFCGERVHRRIAQALLAPPFFTRACLPQSPHTIQTKRKTPQQSQNLPNPYSLIPVPCSRFLTSASIDPAEAADPSASPHPRPANR